MHAKFSAILFAAARLVAGHYTFPDLITNGVVSTDWEYVRMTANYETQNPVTDVTSQAIRCYELSSTTASTTSIATVAAGSTIGFKADNTLYHPGYIDVYMSAASPAANSASAGLSNTWFKVYEDPPTWTAATGLVFPSASINEVTFTIPKSLPTGQYLVRVQQIALHVAETYGGAQFYIGCGQVSVTGGGTGKPSPTVAFPGVYTGYEPGILINIYDLPSNYTGYVSPGPAVWQG